MSPYREGWSSWLDVAVDFSTGYYHGKDADAKALAEIPEPEEVIFATYTSEGYEGSAYVVYRNGDKFFTVSGGHCSCYGLEGQWNPEEYPSLDALIACLTKGNYNSYAEQGAIDALKALRTPNPATSVPLSGTKDWY